MVKQVDIGTSRMELDKGTVFFEEVAVASLDVAPLVVSADADRPWVLERYFLTKKLPTVLVLVGGDSALVAESGEVIIASLGMTEVVYVLVEFWASTFFFLQSQHQHHDPKERASMSRKSRTGDREQ